MNGMKKSSTFILEFTTVEPINEWEYAGLRYIYRESRLFEPGYYTSFEPTPKKSLFYLLMRPQNYKITKIASNEEIININL